MEMTERLKSLTQDQQSRVMHKLFEKLTFAFGNQMAAKWQGLDMQAVYQDWAEALSNFSLGAINFGIGFAKQQEFPPSQGAFVGYCKEYRAPLIADRLENLHVKDTEKGLVELNRIKEMLAAKMTGKAMEQS